MEDSGSYFLRDLEKGNNNNTIKSHVILWTQTRRLINNVAGFGNVFHLHTWDRWWLRPGCHVGALRRACPYESFSEDKSESGIPRDNLHTIYGNVPHTTFMHTEHSYTVSAFYYGVWSYLSCLCFTIFVIIPPCTLSRLLNNCRERTHVRK